MGDTRYNPYLEAIRGAPDQGRAIRQLADDEVVQALAAASKSQEPYLANVLASEAMNRLHRAATVTDTIAEGTYAVNTAGRITFVNPAAERMLGWRRPEVIGTAAFEQLRVEYPDGRSIPDEEWPAWQRMSEGRAVEGEACFVRGDGSVFPALFAWAPIRHDEDVVGAVLTFRDITERKRQEETLAFQNSLLEAQNEASGHGILVLDAEGGFVSYNRRFAEVWGLSTETDHREDHEAALAAALLQVEDEAAFFAPVKGIRTRPEGVWDEIRLKGGRVLERYGAAIRGPGGEYRGSVWNFQDITERSRTERDRALLAAIVVDTDDAIVSKDLQGVITSWNPAAERIFGFSAEEAVGRRIDLIIPPDRSGEETRIISKVRAGERIERFETVRQRKGGGTVRVVLSVSPIRDAKGQIIGASKIAREADRARG